MLHIAPGTFGGFWVDSDNDGIPDVVDPLPNDPNNNSAWWQGGAFTIDGVQKNFPGQWHLASAGDADYDGIPDDIDPLPNDASNTHTFYWPGGSFIINNQMTSFNGGTFNGIGADSDNDGIPDIFDPYPNDPSNANVTNQYTWGGGYYVVNNNYQWVSGGTFTGTWTDSDNDGIPDPADPYPTDSNNGNVTQSYWGGGSFTVNHQTVYFGGGYFNGPYVDSDNDGIPDFFDAYPNDANNGNDNYLWAGGTYRVNNADLAIPGGTYPGSWIDSDGDGIPDPADPYPTDATNGNTATETFDWNGGTFRINNADVIFDPGTFDGTWVDTDNDGIPDSFDPYPGDASNGNTTFYWVGGTYRIANADQLFAENTYPGVWADSDGDGIPDSLDPYPSDPYNANTQFYWVGGTYTISDQDQIYASGYYDGDGGDMDGDGIPDSVDPFLSDPNNNNTIPPTFAWAGGAFPINNGTQFFAPGTYPGVWGDIDQDGIPDSIDPYPNDSNNGNDSTFWWEGGTFTINNNPYFFAAASYPGVMSDQDGDGIPDSLDPYPADANNNNDTNVTTFYWGGGSFSIDNVSVNFPAATYNGVWTDSDNDGIPDAADPYPNDARNHDTTAESFYWAGGSFYVDGVLVTWPAGYYSGSSVDSDADGIPDFLDIHPTDSFNNTSWWAGGTFSINEANCTFSAQYYAANVGDSDGDGIPDSIDPYPYDAQNGLGFDWPATAQTIRITFTPNHYVGVMIDSDGDGIPDVADPLPNDYYNGNDSDHDGIPDSVEARYPGLLDIDSPADAHTLRADGITYLQAYNYKPNQPLSQLISSTLDSDGDGMPDLFEIKNGLNPFSPNDAAASKAGDFVSNLEKYQLGINLNMPVTQAQYESVTGLSWDVFLLNHNQHLADAEDDPDGDGVSNIDELVTFHTDPHVAKSRPTDAIIRQAIIDNKVSATTLRNFRHLVIWLPPATHGDGGVTNSISGGANSGSGGTMAPGGASSATPNTGNFILDYYNRGNPDTINFNNQDLGQAGTTPLKVTVYRVDSSGNRTPTAGVPVTFTVLNGRTRVGSLEDRSDAATSFTVYSGVGNISSGLASVRYFAPFEFGDTSTIQAEVPDPGGAHVGQTPIVFTVTTKSLTTLSLPPLTRLGRVTTASPRTWEAYPLPAANLFSKAGTSVAVVEDMVLYGSDTALKGLQRSVTAGAWTWVYTDSSRLPVVSSVAGAQLMSYDSATGLLVFTNNKANTPSGKWPVGVLQYDSSTRKLSPVTYPPTGKKPSVAYVPDMASAASSNWCQNAEDIKLSAGRCYVSFNQATGSGHTGLKCSLSDKEPSFGGSFIPSYTGYWNGGFQLATFGPLLARSYVPGANPAFGPDHAAQSVYTSQRLSDGTDSNIVGEDAGPNKITPPTCPGGFPGVAVAMSGDYLVVGSVPNGAPAPVSGYTFPPDRSSSVRVYYRDTDSWRFLQDIPIFDGTEGFDGGEMSLAVEGDRIVVAAYGGSSWLSNVGTGSARGNGATKAAQPPKGSVLEQFKLVTFTPNDRGGFSQESVLFEDHSHLSPATTRTAPSAMYYRDFSLAADNGTVVLGFPTASANGKVLIWSDSAVELPATAAVDTEIATVNARQYFPNSPAHYSITTDNSAFKAVNTGGDNWSIRVGSSPLTVTAGATLGISVSANSLTAPVFLTRKVLRYKVKDLDLAPPANLVATTGLNGSGKPVVNLTFSDTSVGETKFSIDSRVDSAIAWAVGSVSVPVSTNVSQSTGNTIAASFPITGTPVWIDFRVQAAVVAGGVTSKVSSPSQTLRLYLKQPDGSALLGDADGDGVPDNIEGTDGTNPNDPNSNSGNSGSAFYLITQTPLAK